MPTHVWNNQAQCLQRRQKTFFVLWNNLLRSCCGTWEVKVVICRQTEMDPFFVVLAGPTLALEISNSNLTQIKVTFRMLRSSFITAEKWPDGRECDEGMRQFINCAFVESWENVQGSCYGSTKQPFKSAKIIKERLKNCQKSDEIWLFLGFSSWCRSFVSGSLMLQTKWQKWRIKYENVSSFRLFRRLLWLSSKISKHWEKQPDYYTT